jgi:hypothetical protein
MGWMGVYNSIGQIQSTARPDAQKSRHILEVTMKKSCPNEEMLAAYVEGLLPDHQKPWMETHLSACGTCLEEFKLTNSMVRGDRRFAADTAPSEVTDSAVRLITSRNVIPNIGLEKKIKHSLSILYAKLLHHLRLPMRYKWQLAPIRGSRKAVSDDLFRIKKSLREFDIEIEIEKTGENMAHIRVRLLERNGCGDGIRVTLKRGERELCSSLFSGDRVLFEDISFGPCKLIFDRDGVSLGAYLFDIKETRNGKK